MRNYHRNSSNIKLVFTPFLVVRGYAAADPPTGPPPVAVPANKHPSGNDTCRRLADSFKI